MLCLLFFDYNAKTTNQIEQMPPQRLSLVTRGFEFRGQPIKSYIFFLKNFLRIFKLFFNFFLMQLFSADATIALKKSNYFLVHENMKKPSSKVAHNS